MSLILRPYQSQAISDLRLAYRDGARAPLLVMPTGAGKTCVMAEILRALEARGRNAIVLVHRRELIAQTTTKLQLAGVQHGIIAAGIQSAAAPIQVASVQTLARRLAQISTAPDLVVIDEAHHATAGSWQRALDHWPHALRLGVTATPTRMDGRGLSAVFDRLVFGPSVADLVGAGYLTNWKIYAPPQIADLSHIRRRAGDYAIDQAAEAMDRPTVTGDAIAHYNRLAAGQRGIAFCCNVQHAEHVASSFNAAGIAAATLLGSTDPLVRDSTVQQFAAGQIQVLVTVDVVSEGFDIPAAGCAILLRPTQSLGLYLQQVGRVLRPAPGKAAAIVLDHVGNVHRHGFPDDPRDWSLDDRLKRAAGAGGAAPSVRTCPACFAAFKPAPLCPCCGAACAPPPRTIRQQDGELKELQRVNAQLRKAERRKARTIGELLALAKQRGYSPAWAWKVHNARSRSA
jgi:superfamily II DNA or RNA helicase